MTVALSVPGAVAYMQVRELTESVTGATVAMHERGLTTGSRPPDTDLCHGYREGTHMPHTTPTARTLITAAGTADSADKWGCPGVHELPDRTDRYVITRDIEGPDAVRPDPDAAAMLAPHMSPGESAGAVPPWVPCQLMDLSTLGRFMDDHLQAPVDPDAPEDEQLRQVCRIEGLERYEVATDPNWQRWQDGAYEPDWVVKKEWDDQLEHDAEHGIEHLRVRLFGDPDELAPGDVYRLSEHEVYECTWGYALNTQEHAGRRKEDVRVLLAGEHQFPAEWMGAELWVVNRKIVVPMNYDRRGRFHGAGWLGARESAPYVTDWDRLWKAAEPFGTWWARHGEYHRGSRLVA